MTDFRMVRQPMARPWQSLMSALVVAVFAGSAGAQQDNPAKATDLAAIPVCSNNKGEQVKFSTTDRGRPGLAAGMAIRDGSGKPVVMRSNFSAAPA